ncbi:flavodoxin [Microbacterium sp.]|uniref:flavodoxin family protein n=1 Tax=Microbacterium sp. TaxID=51671 RepID=UPI002622543E|nr:flavodoxin [Microbacterium sp.]
MARLLIVHHSPTPQVAELAAAVLRGAHTASSEGVEVIERAALEAMATDLLDAHAVIFGTTANFGYISGALKHFFDTTYTDTHEATRGRAFSYWIHRSHDTTGAERAMQSITTGYGLRLAADPVVFTGDVGEHLTRAEELGASVAWSLTL